MTSPGGAEITVTTNGVMASPGLDSDEKALLAKLEEANRLLEADEKSLKSLSAHSSKSGHSRQGSASGHSLKTHSRQGSISSMMSGNSVSSNLSNLPPEDMSGTTAEEAWAMWGDLVNDWESISKKRPNLIRELVRKGIPHHFRGIVWPLLCEASDSSAKEKYAEYLKMSSPCERLIRRDIARTYPEHDFFKEKNGLGQESLFNVMKAYSILDKEVGYCQGSGFIVGLLLMQMPEEEAFAVFVAIMQEYKLRELFKPNMIQLGLCMFQLDCMVQEQLLPLHNHFQSHGFCPSMFASSWFLTLFTSALTLNVACRIFDIFLLEGLETIFRVGFAILQMCQIDLLQTDLEGMLRYFQKVVPAKFEECPDILLSTAFQVKYSSKRMKKLEKEYNQLKTKEQEEQVEVRRLRSENKLLRQRIENLEKETETLAGRLVQQQVNSAQREEEQFGLKRELSQLKQRHHNTLLKLDTAKNELGELKDRNNSVTSTDSNEDLVHQLQQELSRVRHQEVESTATIRELKAKLRELDNVNQQLQRDPTVELQQLQEDLIACKMREAESSLSLKELQQKVIELEKTWHKIHEKGPIKDSKQQLTEEIMTMRIREAHAIGELREMKQKVMDLETQNQINQRHIRRMEEEKEKQQEKMEESEGREKELRASLKDLDRKLADHESQRKEEAILSKIKDTEHSQMVAVLRRRVAELEIENQELVTAGQLQDRKGENHALQCRIAELEEEIMQLKMAKKLHSLSSLALNHITFDTESETDDIELMRRSKGSNSGMTDSIMKLRLELDSTTEEEGSCDYDADNSNVKRKTSRKKRKSHYSSKDVTPKSHQANRSLSDDSVLNDSLDTTLKEDLTVIYNGASSHEPDRAGVMMDVTSISTDSGIPKDKADTSREASPLMSDTSNPPKDGAA